MLYYKIDVVAALKAAGHTMTTLKKDGIFGGRLIDQIYAGKVLGITGLDRLCALLQLQPGDLIAWNPDPDESPKN